MSSISFLARRGIYLDSRDELKGHAVPGKSASPLQYEKVTVASCPVDVPSMDDEARIDSV